MVISSDEDEDMEGLFISQDQATGVGGNAEGDNEHEDKGGLFVSQERTTVEGDNAEEEDYYHVVLPLDEDEYNIL